MVTIPICTFILIDIYFDWYNYLTLDYAIGNLNNNQNKNIVCNKQNIVL